MQKRIFKEKINRLSKKQGIAKSALYFLVVLLLLITLSLLIQGYINSKWSKKSQINLAIVNKNQHYFVKIDKRLNEVLVYKFDDNTVIEIAGGYGEYEIEKVKQLAQQEKLNLGEMMADSMTFYFGVMTDGYITWDKGSEFNIKKNILVSLFKIARCNLNIWDLVRMLIFTQGLRAEDVKMIEIAQQNFYEKENRPDGTLVLKLDKNKFDLYVLSHLADMSFLEEKFFVEIFNTTNYPGLAGIFGRVIRNSGFDLVGARQAKNNYQKSFVLVDDGLINNQSINVFSNHFNLKLVKKSEYKNSEESFGDRAGVVFVLGDDFVERYF